QLAQLQKFNDQFVQLKKDTDSLVEWRSRQFYQNPQSNRVGKIRLRNEYAQRVRIFVNDRSYTLEPGQTELIELPAGTFAYEIPNIQEQRTRTLSSGETFNIIVHNK